MAFDDAVVVISCLMVKGMVGGAFLEILIDMFALFLFAKWAEGQALEKLNKFKEIIK
jgi:hypothetical protein